MGHLKADEGLYLFAPDDAGTAVRRVFVPADNCGFVLLGKSAEEAAMERWVATPEALLRAIEQQRHSRIMSVGDALIELGLVTRGVVDQVARLQGPKRDQPLGEMLVDAGHIERADLQTALAHKMGYPVVDLTRFPIQAEATALLSERSMHELRALPVMKHGERLFVAVDDLARVPPLKGLRGLAGLEVVPVLAPRGRLAIALSSLGQLTGRDLWASNVPFADTPI
jgi:Type II secretion system (T2SS), protein E, N-terminal domain